MTPFDFVKAINSTKENLFVDAQSEKDYNSFVINRSLSYFHDTVMYANEVNRYGTTMPKQWQFEFLKSTIPKRSRFAKWIKKDTNANLDCVQQHYNYSTAKAVECLSILNEQQIQTLKQAGAKGGIGVK